VLAIEVKGRQGWTAGAAVVVLSLLLAGCQGFPDVKGVQGFLTTLQETKEHEQRSRDTQRFLGRMSKPRTAAEVQVAKTALHLLADYYLRTQDAAVLEAVDGTSIEGDFATAVCGFYATILSDSRTRGRYSRACEPVRRCSGHVLTAQDVNAVCSGTWGA